MTFHSNFSKDAELKLFLDNQIKKWPEAAQRYDDFLRLVKRKNIMLADVAVEVMYNPARAVSTCAAVDAKSIRERKCFLCNSNRPALQQAAHLLGHPEFEILVNPFPLARYHFTIAAIDHRPQNIAPLKAMAKAAITYPGFLFFFNGAQAGASAPDHLHFQGVEIEDAPIVKNNNFPYSCKVFCVKSTDEAEALAQKEDIFSSALQNTFVFSSPDNYGVKIVSVPRKSHRPSCYYANDHDKLLISPGALDVAGKIVTVTEHDFERVDAQIIDTIYREIMYYD